MRRIFQRILLLFLTMIILSSSVLSLDKLTGFVNDEAGVISPEYETRLNEILYELKLNTSVEMAVATVKTTGGVPIEEYSLNLAHKVLGDKEKDNGLLILLAVEDRKYRIEVGYGLEPIIPDLVAARIGREVMEPSFRTGNYGKGLYDGVVVLSAILRNDTSQETEVASQLNSQLIKQNLITLALFLLILFLMILPFIIMAYKDAKKKAAKEGKEDDKDFIAAMILASMFGKGGSGGSGGFGGFGGGSSGGFGGGGFGGGGFSGKF